MPLTTSIPAESWWTGKDSNLRSPQGAADLQSAGFSHSPTRPRNSSTPTACPDLVKRAVFGSGVRENTKWTRVQRHQPFHIIMPGFAPPHSPTKIWWSWRRDLNPRPSDYKSDALPAELRQRCSNRTIIAETARFLQVGIGRVTSNSETISVEKRGPDVIPSHPRTLLIM
jgi:hypothetical protein